MSTPLHSAADQAFQDFLVQVSARPELELEWVDMLSQLEYVGCRKILKAVPFPSIDAEVLRHVAEEASHAWLLKAVVAQGGKTGPTWESGKFAAAGWKYFQRLDHGVSSFTESASLRYPGVSWAIEQRVLKVYPLYLEITKNDSLFRALKQILMQERRHEGQFGAVTYPEGYREKVLELEATLWRDFVMESRQLAGMS